ncbi:Scr1 family TA system antitoxin-like transcriptional regulator [Nocardia sp. NPDC004068]|uniref:Scr1 family TA system antitoxin-like transcriptional regulator n=1 Tax=Nocardia sp. NPDC004068 TaxID=3364303 RepID=UPI0036762EA4
MAPLSPTVARWELVLRLREWREKRGFDSATFARRVGFTPANWSHVEKGRRVLTGNTIGPVLDLLEVPEPDREQLLALLAASKTRGWWSGSAALLGPEPLRYYGMEYGAARVRGYDSLVVPALLQTESYARALIAADVTTRPVQGEQLVAIRLRRAERLRDADPIRLTAVLGEAALVQQVGAPEILRAQLSYLVESLTELDTVEVRVLPFDAPAGAALGGASFQLLDFTAALPTFAWIENAVLRGGVDNPDQVRELAFAYERALDRALGPADSAALIRRYARG